MIPLLSSRLHCLFITPPNLICPGPYFSEIRQIYPLVKHPQCIPYGTSPKLGTSVRTSCLWWRHDFCLPPFVSRPCGGSSSIVMGDHKVRDVIFDKPELFRTYPISLQSGSALTLTALERSRLSLTEKGRGVGSMSACHRHFGTVQYDPMNQRSGRTRTGRNTSGGESGPG